MSAGAILIGSAKALRSESTPSVANCNWPNVVVFLRQSGQRSSGWEGRQRNGGLAPKQETNERGGMFDDFVPEFAL